MKNALCWLGFIGFGAIAVGSYFFNPVVGALFTVGSFLCLMGVDD